MGYLNVQHRKSASSAPSSKVSASRDLWSAASQNVFVRLFGSRINGAAIGFASLAIVALLARTAAAGPSTSAIGDYMGLFVEATVGQYQMLCSAREPATAEQWKADVRRWREANSQPLGELRTIASSIERAARDRAFDPATKESAKERETRLTALTGFMMLAGAQPANELARANDQQAGTQCKIWRETIAPGGPLEAGLPGAVLGAKRILQLESAPRK